MAFDRPAPTAPCRRLRVYAMALTALFAVITGLSVVLAGAHIWRARVFDRQAEGRLIEEVLVSQAEADAANAAVSAVSIVWWLLAAASAVVFITWQFRHAQNARALGAFGGLSHPAWAIGAWLVPFGSVVLGPRQLYRSRAPGVGRTTIVVKVITWWGMALALAALVLWLANGIWVDGAEHRNDFLRNSTADYLHAVAALIGAVAAAFVIYIVQTLTRRQDDALEHRGVVDSGPSLA